ncbi:two-component system sensor histidine kinase NtrB [Polymorphobacter fuscus]|uniref:histidine kinase n=1 Tax=Sandarakinorhabdus fusca TaxID=1439888 RepID=A0A7C9KLP0_9SPHN|nr:ATP-binding protein [Polymorphobacter fuscus]KAB7648860.1 two-component sensor histidine kinase [Polymorphobacter fuscus]MQT16444.1 two-component sensor histidine kinase [Polymorphobacter fuscus]NJC07266.1 two-component system nitrogen regulation sensor histidine kinase GlnL [Polymorphobacter fuscus]
MAGPAELLSGLAVPAVLVAPDGRLSLANIAAETFLNASQQALAERGWAAAFGRNRDIEGLVRRARSEGGGCAAYDMALVFPAGRSVRADVLVAPVGDAPGWLTVAIQTRSVATMVDRQVQQQGAARSAVGVAAMLAHEIKNPLSGIRGAAQLLATGADADGRELTDLIVAEVDRIAKLVDRMESFTDTRPLRLRPENIHEVLGHVRRLAQQGFGAGIAIRERYDPSLPMVAANRDSLVQVFLNLLKNAVEAVETDGDVVISTAFRAGLKVRPEGGGAPVSLPIEVRIIDSGPGIHADLGDHIFEPFVTSKRGGSGLGLALVAKIVADHGGVVEYERAGEPERTIFRVLLPVAGT